MDYLAILALILAIVGIIGSIIPMIPGPPISWGAFLALYYSSTPSGSISTTFLFVWLVIAVIITVIDFVVPPLLTKVVGGHKEAQYGATIGMIVGIFLTPIGMIIGSFLGAFLGEYLASGKDGDKSIKVALVTFAGFIITTGLKFAMCLYVLWEIISTLFF